MWQSTLPLDTDELCKEGSFFDDFFTQNYEKLFAFEGYRALVETKVEPDISKSFNNGSFCAMYLNKYVSFVSVESPSNSVTKSRRERRTSFNDQLGTIGGTLGLFTGKKILDQKPKHLSFSI